MLIRAFVPALMSTCIAATEANAQMVFSGIRYGENAGRVSSLMRGLGYRGLATTAEGDSIYTNADAVVLTVLIDGRLAAVLEQRSGSMVAVADSLTRVFRREPRASGGGLEWTKGDTVVFLDRGSGDRGVSIFFRGPAYTDAAMEARHFPPLDPSRWSVVYSSATFRVAAETRSTPFGGGLYRVWKRQQFAEEQESGVRQAATLEEIDCRQRRSRILQAVFYDAAGNTVPGASLNLAQPWEAAAPQSVGEEILLGTCRLLQRR